MKELDGVNLAFKAFQANPTQKTRMTLIQKVVAASQLLGEEVIGLGVIATIANIKNQPSTVHVALKKAAQSKGVNIGTLGGGNTQ